MGIWLPNGSLGYVNHWDWDLLVPEAKGLVLSTNSKLIAIDCFASSPQIFGRDIGNRGVPEQLQDGTEPNMQKNRSIQSLQLFRHSDSDVSPEHLWEDSTHQLQTHDCDWQSQSYWFGNP